MLGPESTYLDGTLKGIGTFGSDIIDRQLCRLHQIHFSVSSKQAPVVGPA